MSCRVMNKAITLLTATLGALTLASFSHSYSLGMLLHGPNPVWGFINNVQIYKGHAYARGIYTNEDGNMVYVVYDEEGKEIEEIGPIEEDGDYHRSFIMSVTEFNQYVLHYEAQMESFEDFYGSDAAYEPVLLTAQEYEETKDTLEVVGSSDPVIMWNGDEDSHRLDESTRSVLVMPPEMLYTDTTQWLLAQYPVDLTQQDTELDTDFTSLIIGREGEILDKREDRIAHRSIFFEDTTAAAGSEDRFDQSLFTWAQDRTGGDLELVAPVKGLPILANMPYRGGSTTNDDGRYAMGVLGTPCPLFFYEHPIYLEAQVYYRSFNPDRPGPYTYFLSKKGYFSCNGYGPMSITPVTTLDFPIDVNILTGSMIFTNSPAPLEIELSSPEDTPQLVYDFKEPEADENGETPSRFDYVTFDQYDFDLDGEFDISECGTLDDEGIFEPLQDGQECTSDSVQGIYLSSYTPRPGQCNDTDEDGVANPEDPECQPQFTRLIDTQKVQEHIGLVKKISEKQVQDTDIFVIRQANGQLLAMRQGLKESEEAYQPSMNTVEAAKDEVKANYRMFMRGPKPQLSRSHQLGLGRYSDEGYSQWQQDSNMAPEFQQLRDADHVRTGEVLEIWAINRATGYIGSKEIVLGENQLSFGQIDTWVPDIEMRPPNLKIWAERTYDIEAGLTKDENRRYLIGNEGVGEADDTYIQINVEWLDQDGSALPDALNSYGYTGRIAYVSGDSSLSDASQAGQARFAIEPGTHVEVVRLSGSIDNQHYYVQVSGVPEAEFDDFALEEEQDRSDDATFEEVEHNLYRPERFVPFKTPQFNEEMSEIQRQAYLLELKRRYEEGEDSSDLLLPSASYNWFYRPDYQFTIYDLAIESLKTTQVLRDESEHEGELTDGDLPFISSKDDIFKAILDIYGTDTSRLETFDSEDDLVFAFGEQEINLSVSENQTLKLTNIEHLNKLSAEDYLSMRIYSNKDVENLLWEYAFAYLDISVNDKFRDTIIGHDIALVSADNPEIDINATLHSYVYWDQEQIDAFSNMVRWEVISGSATLSSSRSEFDESGTAGVTLSVTPDTDNSVQVAAYLGDHDDTKSIIIEVGVVAGVPKRISLSSFGQAYLKGVGSVKIEAEIYDKHNNLVTNGTGVSIRERGHVFIEEFDGLTSAGKIEATIKGGSVAGSYPVTVSAGYATSTINVPVQDMPVHIEGLPSEMRAGQEYDLVAVIDGSQPLEGLFVDIGANGGQILKREPRSDSDGRTAFRYKAPSQPGTYEIGAKLDINNPHVANIDVQQSTRQSESGHKYIITGFDGTANTQLKHFSGYSAEMLIPQQYSFNIESELDESVELVVGDWHRINREPVYFSRFRSLIYDENRQIKAKVKYLGKGEGADYQSNALVFKKDESNPLEPLYSYWEIDETLVTDLENIGINFQLYPTIAGKVLSINDGAIEVSLDSNQLIVAVNTLVDDEGTPVAKVEKLSLPVTNSAWHEVSTGLREGVFYLVIDDTETSIALEGTVDSGLLAQDANWLSMGGGFTGRVGMFRLYDWSSEPIVEVTPQSFDNLSGESTQIMISPTPYYQDNQTTLASIPLTIYRNGVPALETNVVPYRVVKDLAESVYSIKEDPVVISQLSASEVLERIPLDGGFSDLQLSANSLLSGSATSANDDSYLRDVVASISWLRHSNRYEDVANRAMVLQAYFSNSGNEDLALYAAEFLQEAMIQESAGSGISLRMLATSLTVWAELIESAPDTASIVASSIENRTDFWRWARFMALPAKGWATDVIPVPRHNVLCDQITASVNIGTPLEFSALPCRATGTQMAGVIEEILDVEPTLKTNPAGLNTYLKALLMMFKELPIEYKQIFDSSPRVSADASGFVPVETAHAAGPLVYAVRVLAVMIKQSIRKGTGGSPANLIAFLQGGTTSRVDRIEMIAAMAYLGSRLDGVDGCDSCETLNDQVSATVLSDMAAWFAAIGLAKEGVVTDESLLKKQCTIAGNGHGKAFELVATAAYHSLFEFGDVIGLADSDKYKILLSDPRKDEHLIEVAIMHPGFWGVGNYSGSPHQRKPDLILNGDGDSERTWVELKSWKYNGRTTSPVYMRAGSDSLRSDLFPNWNGKSRSKSLKYTTSAQKQKFLDFVATQNALDSEFWADKAPNPTMKPDETVTWVQVWKPGERRWRALTKAANGKYKLEDRETVRHVATPWLDDNDISDKLVITGVSKQFMALQKYLTTAPSLDDDAFETSTGMSRFDYEKLYQSTQVSSSVAEYSQSSVRPFTLLSFYVHEAGESVGSNMRALILDQFGGGKYKELAAAIDSGQLSKETIEQLRDEITDEILELLGPLQVLAIDIPLLSDLENAAVDLFVGDEVEALRKAAAEMSLSESLFENFCEYP